MFKRRCKFSSFHTSLVNPNDSVFDGNSEVKHMHIAGTFKKGQTLISVVTSDRT